MRVNGKIRGRRRGEAIRLLMPWLSGSEALIVKAVRF